MNITKKVCIYILVGLITITGTFTSFYKGAYAFEYVGGALAFEEAIKWLLASVGIISAGGMTADYWENHSQEFEDYCTQQNITDTEVANWQLKLCEGILDKGSQCWQAFKEWASTLTDSSSVSGSVASGSTFSEVFSYMVSAMNMTNYTSYRFANYNADTPIYSGFCYFSASDYPNLVFFLDPGVYSMQNGRVYKDGSRYTGRYMYSTDNYYGQITIKGGADYNVLFSSFTYPKLFLFHFNWVSPSLDDYSGLLHSVNDGSSDSDFISVQPDVTDLDIISSPIPDTDAQEVAIPMPGVSDSDNEASADAYENLIDQVNDGTLQLDDAITQVQDILKIIVYEEETQKIFPKPENDEDQEDLDDKINQNKDNMGFTLGGLETVFPFCIPWDIYAFINLLRADPVPPKVELPFPNPLDPENPWTVEVDFSDWDDGMKIVRLAEDFLFIIGLAVLTRSLIGAGGGDG